MIYNVFGGTLNLTQGLRVDSHWCCSTVIIWTIWVNSHNNRHDDSTINIVSSISLISNNIWLGLHWIPYLAPAKIRLFFISGHIFHIRLDLATEYKAGFIQMF